MCHCRGHPLPPNQKYICERLLLENYFLLHRLRVCAYLYTPPIVLINFLCLQMDPQTNMVYITPNLNEDLEISLEEFAQQERRQQSRLYFIRTVKLYARLCLV